MNAQYKNKDHSQTEIGFLHVVKASKISRKLLNLMQSIPRQLRICGIKGITITTHCWRPVTIIQVRKLDTTAKSASWACAQKTWLTMLSMTLFWQIIGLLFKFAKLWLLQSRTSESAPNLTRLYCTQQRKNWLKLRFINNKNSKDCLRLFKKFVRLSFKEKKSSRKSWMRKWTTLSQLWEMMQLSCTRFWRI